MALISTVSKATLPKGFSYPIGAEQISAALADVPQFTGLQLAFRWRDEFWSSRYSKKIQQRGAIKLIEAHYGEPFREWSLSLNALPSEHKASARQQLLAIGLPGLRNRLMAISGDADYFDYVISYDLALSKIAVQ